MSAKNCIVKKVYFSNSYSASDLIPYFAYSKIAHINVYEASIISTERDMSVIFCSFAQRFNLVPHVGLVVYINSKPVASFAVNTNDAFVTLYWFSIENVLKVFSYSNFSKIINVIRHNVIRILKSFEFGYQIITSHFQSNACNLAEDSNNISFDCIRVFDAIQLLTKADCKFYNSIQVVKFTEEEINDASSHMYTDYQFYENQQHYFALETDRLYFTSYCFTFDITDHIFHDKIKW